MRAAAPFAVCVALAVTASAASARGETAAGPVSHAASAGARSAAKAKPCTTRSRRSRACPRAAMRLTLLPGSFATLNFGATPPPGGTVDFGPSGTSTLTLSGTLTGYTIGRVGYIDVIPIVLTGGAVRAEPAELWWDNACGGARSPTLRSSALGVVTLAPAHPTTVNIDANTALYTGTTSVRIRMPLERRVEGGCGLPFAPTGYADSFDTFTVRGEYGSKTRVDSPVHAVALQACLVPGDPSQPCAGATTAYGALLQVHLVLLTEFHVRAARAPRRA